MNVYFCDVCGVRVTDVDLHSGHGIRRRHDVICAACLDLGHGKEWINNGSAGAAVAVGAGAVGTHAKAPSPAPVVPAIKRARDDLATIDEDAEAASAPTAPPSLDEEAEEADPIPARTPEPPALVPAPIFDDDDSNVLPAPAPAAAHVPPPEDDSGGISALTGADEALDGVPMAPKGGETEASVESPFIEDEARAPASAADVASGRAPAERPAKKDSSRQAKVAKSPSGKSARVSGKSKANKKGMSPVVLISAVSIICLLVCFGVAMGTGMIPGLTPKSQQVIDPNSNLKDLDNAVSAAHAAYQKAMQSQNLADCDAALRKFDDLNTTMKSTEDVLEHMPKPWTEEQIGQSFEDHKVNDTRALRQALTQLRVKLTN